MTGSADPVATVWLCRPARWSEQSAIACCLPWLDARETARWQRLVFARDRHLYLVAHGLLRWALSAAAAAIRPQDWRFEIDAFGCPHLAGPACAPALAFSVSHTRTMAAVAIGHRATLGVDVEALRDPADQALSAATAAFAPSERAWLQHQLPVRRAGSTIRLWALKEAYAKARGLGLHLPLHSFAFELEERRRVRRFMAPPGQTSQGWRFFEATPGGCRLALAYRHDKREGPEPVRLQVGSTAPGRWAPRCTVLCTIEGLPVP